jgi:hypothetical protein
MLSLLKHSPDIYLDETQEELFTQHNIYISLSTIFQTLKRLGFSSKKTCHLQLCIIYDLTYSFLKPQLNILRTLEGHFTWRLAMSQLTKLLFQMRVLSTFSLHINRMGGLSRVR